LTYDSIYIVRAAPRQAFTHPNDAAPPELKDVSVRDDTQYQVPHETESSADRPALVAALPLELRLVEGLRDALVLLDAESRFVFFNARARRGMEAGGRDAAELLGRTPWEAIPFLRQTPAPAELARVRAGYGPTHFEVRHPRLGRWFEIDAMLVDDLLAVYWRDVTAGRRAEEARLASDAELRATHRRLEELVAGAPLAIIVLDNDTNVLMWNEAAVEMFQWTADEVLGKPLPTVPPEEIEALDTMRVRERRGESMRAVTARRRRKDGTVLDVQVSTAPLRDRDGTVIGVIGMVADVSEQRRLEAQLRMAQKMEAVGLLAGGVAHDFNNLLTAIKGFASLLQMAIPPGDESAEFADEIGKAADRAASLTAQLLAFSRRQLLRPEPIDLNARVRGLERMLGLLVSEGGDLSLELDPSLGLVLADPGQLEQVILNLAVNARDAIASRGAGRITIATSNVTLKDEFKGWRVVPAPGEYVRLDVRDNGVGMDAVTQARIFDPFFTTKAAGQGTGLGLATVYGIAKQSGGYVWVNSKLGEGSTFSLFLPRAQAEQRLVAEQPSVTVSGDDLVLLVEDEDGVRRVARRALEVHGFRVLEAANGAEALVIAAQHPVRILVTDVMMPDLLGPAVAAAVHEILPGLPVLYMSGHADEVVREGLLDPSVPFLAKPFTPSQLAARVRQLLDAAR
jgi:two-component system, cell cycle sensor histidine kinase and response regulator CckA